MTTPYGLFNFTRTPFGLCNSGQTFQRFIDHVTRSLDFVFVYLDDLLVTSPDHARHKEPLTILFTRLASREYGIIIWPEKCQFGTSKLSFVGHHVCSEGISPLPTAVLRPGPPLSAASHHLLAIQIPASKPSACVERVAQRSEKLAMFV